MRSSESRAIEATAQRSLAAGTEAREGDVNSYFMSSYENLASYRTPSKDEAALAREPLLDLHEKRTLVHAHGLALVLVEDALGVALDRRFFLEVRPQRLEHALVDLGYRSHPIHGVERTIIGCIGDERGKARLTAIESMPGVEACVPILKPFKLASREVRREDSVIDVGLGVRVGDRRIAVMAGPCSVESESQIMQ